jgi:redox-sensitive bicupin YhaK (pirin superfamily)
MNASSATAQTPGRRILHRTRGVRRGPITRLMSPSDLGQVVKPFVFLDLFESDASAGAGTGLHPHSGIATVTYFMQGSVSYEDTDGSTGLLPQDGMEWMKAGGGAWHGGGPGDGGRTRGFQLWIALPPELELTAAESIYLPPATIPREGPARVLLGNHGRASSTIRPPSPLTYLFVRLAAGERWRYSPPEGQTVGWVAIGAGEMVTSEPLRAGDLAVFEPSEASIEFQARTDTEFVLGSAVPHPYELALGTYSVHTNPDALHTAESRIAQLQASLIARGRLRPDSE